MPEEAHALILQVTVTDKVVYHPIVLCFLYGTLAKRALPHILTSQENDISMVSLEFLRAVRNQPSHGTDPDMLNQFFHCAQNAFQEMDVLCPYSVNKRLISELWKRSHYLGPVFECVYEVG